MTRLLKEPLLHFAILGAILFGLFGLAGKPDTKPPARIVVSTARIENLAGAFVRTAQRQPTPEELRGLIDSYIRDEVFYREGVKLGLDRDDLIIRRRLRQKMEFMAEDVDVDEPTDAELSAYLAAHPDKFRIEDRITFRHVFLSAVRGTKPLESDVGRVAAELANAGGDFDASTLGDDFLLGMDFHAILLSDIGRMFGEDFGKHISTLEPGRWQGPLPSSYGVHFVFVGERERGAQSPLASVRVDVRRDWMNARRVGAEDKFYQALRDQYEVVVEALPTKEQLAGVVP